MWLLCLTLAAPPEAFAVADPVAAVRSAGTFASTKETIPFGSVVVVLESKTHDGTEFVRVRLRDEPKTEFGWTDRTNLGSTKEFDPAMRSEDSVDGRGLTGTRALMAGLYNTRGKYLKEQATTLGVSPTALAAVLKVESSGRAFGPDGRVIIRFENHVFAKRWGDPHRAKFDHHFQFDPKETWKGHRWRKAADDEWTDCHRSQVGEWEMLTFARTLDEEAALLSASYGAGQIMGFNHKRVGYASAKEMLTAFDTGIRPQLDATVAFIRGSKTCMDGLTAKDYTLFARGYNGAGKANMYGERIKEAADAYAEVTKGKKHAE